MDNEIQNRHRRRWLDNCKTDRDDFLNQAIENFDEVVDNMLAPTVHNVECTKPLEYYIDERYEEKVIISDMTRFDAIKDEKLLHTKLVSIIDSGSYVWWQNEKWIVLNEEHNAVPSHRTFIIRKCAIDINMLINGIQYNYPAYVFNATLYSDGLKELTNLSVSSAKYSVMIAENEITNTLNVGSRFIIRGRAFEISLIDDITVKNVRTFTICETVTNSKDDLENDVAHNENSEQKENEISNLKIKGSNKILIGDTLEYELLGSTGWDLKQEIKGVKIVSALPGRCSLKCASDSGLIGKTVTLLAYDYGGNIIDEKEIIIKGMF